MKRLFIGFIIIVILSTLTTYANAVRGIPFGVSKYYVKSKEASRSDSVFIDGDKDGLYYNLKFLDYKWTLFYGFVDNKLYEVTLLKTSTSFYSIYSLFDSAKQVLINKYGMYKEGGLLWVDNTAKRLYSDGSLTLETCMLNGAAAYMYEWDKGSYTILATMMFTSKIGFFIRITFHDKKLNKLYEQSTMNKATNQL